MTLGAEGALDYIRALDWWVLAVIAIFVLRNQLRTLPAAIREWLKSLPGRTESVRVRLPGGVEASAAFSVDAQSAALAPADAPAAVPQAANAPANWELLARHSIILNTLFAGQIAFLRDLRRVPGMTDAEFRVWYAANIAIRPGFEASDPDQFLVYLRTAELIEPDDANPNLTRLSALGRSFLDFEANVWYAQKLF